MKLLLTRDLAWPIPKEQPLTQDLSTPNRREKLPTPYHALPIIRRYLLTPDLALPNPREKLPTPDLASSRDIF
jgi:hypothetical protein